MYLRHKITMTFAALPKNFLFKKVQKHFGTVNPSISLAKWMGFLQMSAVNLLCLECEGNSIALEFVTITKNNPNRPKS